MVYHPRVADEMLQARLASSGAVLIQGPKACGKTRTALQQAASSVMLDVDPSALTALDIQPSLVLEGPTPRLIDEWQLAADRVWNHVRRLVDDRQEPGQFILTGSAVPADDVRRHAGAGRFAVLRMRPMSLFESGHSTGQMSLAALMAGDRPTSPDPGLTVPQIVDRITVGGWPANLSRSVSAAAQANVDYMTNLVEIDINRVEGIKRDPRRINRLLQSIARNVATEVPISQLGADTQGADGVLARSTVYEYLTALDRLMIVEDQPAWSTHLRSKATLRQAQKRHFVDPSLAVAVLRASPQRLLADLNYLGFLFESLAVRDLRIYSEPLGGHVYHYRDSLRREVDIIVQTTQGPWGAFEVKLGDAQIDDAAAKLIAFADDVDSAKTAAPAVLAVITGSNYGYTRPDGVVVLPIGALGP